MKLLSINSKDRNPTMSNSSSDFTILFSTILSNISSVELLSANIPNTIYKIQSYNNILTWTRSSTEYSITIPPGAYTIYSLLSNIQTQMNNTDANNYVLTYSTTTLMVTFIGDSAFSLTFSNKNTCWKELGFSNSNTSSNTTLTSNNAIQLYNPLSLYLLIQQFGGNNITSSGIQFSFKIPMTVNSSGILQFDSNNFYCQKIEFNGRFSFGQLQVLIIDSYGRNINLNNSEWEILLQLNEC